jgi:aminoglycoside phosphotransferase (APT) family kinase protein
MVDNVYGLELIDFAVLAEWMDGQGLESGPISDVVQLTGGSQNVIVKFRRGDRQFVLRRPPEHTRANGNETMRREARVLGALAGTPVPHPGLIGSCPDEAVLGAAFYLMEPVDGFNVAVDMPALHAGDPKIRRRMGLAMAEALAALASVDYRAQGLESFGKPDGFLERQVGRWRSQLESYHDYEGWPGSAELPGVDAVGRWLEDNRPVQSAAGILHGDYHLKNVMFRNDGPELAAIIDWELATIGDPLVDLGWLICTWRGPGGSTEGAPIVFEPWDGFPDPAELVKCYGEASGRDVSAAPWYAVFACYKMGLILEGTYARACAGKAPMDIGQRLHGNALRLLGRANRWMTDGAGLG